MLPCNSLTSRTSGPSRCNTQCCLAQSSTTNKYGTKQQQHCSSSTHQLSKAPLKKLSNPSMMSHIIYANPSLGHDAVRQGKPAVHTCPSLTGQAQHAQTACKAVATSQQLLKWTCSIECGHGHPGTASSRWGYCTALHAAKLSCCSSQYAYNDSSR